ncbi:MAG: nucleotidyltransferase family protein [Desulfuromonadaceae bacterium]|nr:nucleotidyltransferase family protein [Desulfuromonadaceae bacterium]
MEMDAIVLAGGKGTRLQAVIRDVPKPMADINGKPFLHYLLSHLCRSGIRRVILAVGYKHEIISNFFGSSFQGCELHYCVEDRPLGTGGAIRLALDLVASKQVLILNGDTLFNVDIQAMMQRHCEKGADLTLALKPMTDFERYGTVLECDGRVTGFVEKKYCASGLINAGIYVMRKDLLLSWPAGTGFSFEGDFLEKKAAELSFQAFVADNYFIDIGVPEDYLKACKDFERMLD